MKVALAIQSGLHAGRRVNLRPGQSLTVGRTDAAEFVVDDDPTISRIHFSITATQSGCTLSDLGSTSGTIVNGQPCTARILLDGDLIVAGQTSFRVHIVPLKSTRRPIFEVTDSPIVSKTPDSTSVIGNSVESLYLAGFQDKCVAIRQAAFTAAALSGEPLVLKYCREIVDKAEQTLPYSEAMMVAVLGDSQDISRVRLILQSQQYGIARFGIVGSFGNPMLVPELISIISHTESLLDQVGAAMAFKKITGIEIDSAEVVQLGDGNDEVDALESAFLDEGVLADRDLVIKGWEEKSERLMQSERLYRGIDVSQSFEESFVDQLDLETCQQILVRESYWGKPNKRLFELISTRLANNFITP